MHYIQGCDANAACQLHVCAGDAYCCSTAWDATCVQYAEENWCSSTTTTTVPETTSTTEMAQYIVGDEYMSWNDAEDWCNDQGYHLASIHNDDQNAAALTMCTDCWIGLQCIDNNQYDFEWTDGSDWDYSNWNENEPNNWQNTNEDCAHMYASGYWNDNSCDNTYRPLCAVLDGMSGSDLFIHFWWEFEWKLNIFDSFS